MQSEYGLAPVALSDDGPGRSYARRGAPESPVTALLRKCQAEWSLQPKSGASAGVGSHAGRVCAPSDTM